MSEPLNLRAYYYGFEPTGELAVDRVLAAVARAGKAYHHTDQWTEDDGDGSPVAKIQAVANAAAAECEALRAQLAQARRDALEEAANHIWTTIESDGRGIAVVRRCRDAIRALAAAHPETREPGGGPRPEPSPTKEGQKP